VYQYNLMKYGLLIFHQGWTDIMNCLGMVSYNAKQYDVLWVVYREEARPLADFYSRTVKKILKIFIYPTLFTQ
jgi:hypothetical protein